jgi:hypothetical protein
MRLQTTTHSLQMETTGIRSVATMSFSTWVWSFPQKEHFATVFLGIFLERPGRDLTEDVLVRLRAE